MEELRKCPWPDWEVKELIGRGSFGTVYEIRRQLIGGEIEKSALKVISIPQSTEELEEMYSDGYDDESITETFRSHLKSIVSEYSIMNKMDGSDNVVSCKDICYIQHDDGIGWDIFIRMELLTPLIKALPGEVDEATVIRIARDLCRALVLCKKYEIVHRDIKPQNIFMSANGSYKLGDFGIAKTVERTMGGTKIGTYKYMAPEVYNNQPYGSAADIYSLGLVLYWLLNGRRMPFLPPPPAKLKAGMDEEARMRRLMGEALPAPAHGSERLKQIVLKACAYDQKDRYISAADMLEDLNNLDGNAAQGVLPAAEKSDRESQYSDLTVVGDPDLTVVGDPDLTVVEEPELTVVEDLDRTVLDDATVVPDAREDADATVCMNAYYGQNFAPAVPEVQMTQPQYQPANEFAFAGMTAERLAEEERARAAANNRRWQEFRYDEQSRAEKKKKIGIVVALSLAALLLISLLLALLEDTGSFGSDPEEICEKRGHQWVEATCSEPKTCTRCKKESGTKLEHKWSIGNCVTPIVCSICGASEGKMGAHNWEAATCQKPKTCSLCGETTGYIEDHIWAVSPECLVADTCILCGAEGEIRDHVWSTTDENKLRVCEHCSEVQIPANFSAENEIGSIRMEYNNLKKMQSANLLQKTKMSNGSHVYTDQAGNMRILVIYEGIDGIKDQSRNYRREYYFSDGQLIFAFYEGYDAHRFYFYEGRMFRWRHTLNGVDTDRDLEFGAKYRNWEQLILDECGMYD